MKDKFIAVLILLIFSAGVVSSVMHLMRKPKPEKKEMPGFDISLGKGKKQLMVIHVYGPIMTAGDSGGITGSGVSGSDAIVGQLKNARNSDNVCGVVLRINSPGGTVAATQEIYHEILKLREAGKPVTVSMADVAASGGYYISCAADKIYANGGTMTGSIGVIIGLPSLKGLFEHVGIDYQVIASGKWKDMGSMARDLKPEERDAFKKIIMDTYGQFLQVVKKGRLAAVRAKGHTEQDLESYAQGQIFSAVDAEKKGLIDGIATYEDVIKKTWKMAGQKGSPRVTTPRKNFLKQLIRLVERESKGSLISKEALNSFKEIRVEYRYVPGI